MGHHRLQPRASPGSADSTDHQIACWTWAPNGWLFQLGSLDFAGGGPVHMTSGTGALALSIWLGKRRGYGTPKLAYRPSNVRRLSSIEADSAG